MATAHDSPQHALALLSRGLTVREVSQALGCSRPTCYKLLKHARMAELFDGPPSNLTPVFPVAAFTPRSTCNCKAAPIRIGSLLCCGVCWASGWDWLASMQARPLPPDRKKYRPGKLKGGKA